VQKPFTPTGLLEIVTQRARAPVIRTAWGALGVRRERSPASPTTTLRMLIRSTVPSRLGASSPRTACASWSFASDSFFRDRNDELPVCYGSGISRMRTRRCANERMHDEAALPSPRRLTRPSLPIVADFTCRRAAGGLSTYRVCDRVESGELREVGPRRRARRDPSRDFAASSAASRGTPAHTLGAARSRRLELTRPTRPAPRHDTVSPTFGATCVSLAARP